MKKFWKINNWRVIDLKPNIFITYTFLFLSWVILSAVNSQGGQSSVLLQAVNLPLEISVMLFLKFTVLPINLGSFPGFKILLFKLIITSSPLRRFDFKLIKAELISNLLLSISLIKASFILIVLFFISYLNPFVWNKFLFLSITFEIELT